MLKYNADNELEPELAKELPEVSADGLTLTYKLEKDTNSVMELK